MTIPVVKTLMLPVLRRLVERQWATSELAVALADEYGLTAEERHQLLPSGRQAVFANRVHWALAHLKGAELINRVSRGQYAATGAGRALITTAPAMITRRFLHQYPAYVKFMNKTSTEDGETLGEPPSDSLSTDAHELIASPEERLGAADRDLKIALTDALLTRLRAMSAATFEQLIIDLLVAIGYGGTHREAAERLGRSGDGGVDGVIREDKLGLDTIYIQAKRYAEDNAVGTPALRDFAGALLNNGATKGVFATTSRFAAQARDMASGLKSHRIVLIDGPELARLMIEHDIGVRTVQTIKLQRVDLEAYEEEAGS